MTDIPKKDGLNPINPQTGRKYKLPAFWCGRNKGLEELGEWILDYLDRCMETEWQLKGMYDTDKINLLIEELEEMIK